jgi:hypothetical protein
MRKLFVLVLLAALAACGERDANDNTGMVGSGAGGDAPVESTPPAPPEQKTLAETSDIQWPDSEPGITPFIAFARLTGQSLSGIRSITYIIEPRTGSVSKPVRVSYSRAALEGRGRFESAQLLRLPLFGLYAGHTNAVTLEVEFEDGSRQSIDCTVTTAGYADPNGVYDHPLYIKARAADEQLGFDFFAMKSGLGTPVVVDTDGAMRWVGVSTESSISSIFADNGFVIGDQRSTRVRRLELDGTEIQTTVESPIYRHFHHNIEPGKSGLLIEMDTTLDRETRVSEYTLAAGVSKEWDFGAIVTEQMRAGGDDPSLFVRPAVDWFHVNSAIYDPRDDSLIVSSRENFVMKVDYQSGAIRWLLGDPTKYWWSFPSLRARALTLEGGGLYPIGQHALSLTSGGLLLLFNAGNPSESQPAGAPRGEARSYSAVSAYRIDADTMTATEEWNFDYGQALYSDHCSSVYEAPGESLLISYARVDNRQHARLVGLNRAHQVVLDFQYEARGCNASWNAVPIPFEDMRFL